jgi:phage-related protein
MLYEILTWVGTGVIELFNIIRDNTGPSLAYLSGLFQSTFESIKSAISTSWQFIKDVFFTYINFIIGITATLFDFLVPGWQGALASIYANAQAMLATIAEAIRVGFEFILAIVQTSLQFLSDTWQFTWNSAKTAFEVVWSAITDIFDTAAAGIKSTMDTLMKPIEKVIALAEKALSLSGSAIKSGGIKISNTISSILSRGSSITGKAKGGPVTGNRPYIIGEVGPELFVPNSSGRIIPNNQLAGAGAGGNVFNITLSNNSFMGERDMAEKVGDQLIRIIKQNTRL